MTSKIRIIISPEPSNIIDDINCTIHFNDSDMIGCKAEYSVVTKVIVHMKNGSNEEIVHIRKKFIINFPQMEFVIPANKLPNPSYQGKEIDIITNVHVIVNDKIFNDSEEIKIITRQATKKIIKKQKDKQLIYNEDKRSLIKSIKMLPTKMQKKLLQTVLITSIVITLFLFFGIHDFMVGADKSYIYINEFAHYHLIIILTAMSLIFGSIVINESIKEHLSSWITASLNKKNLPSFISKNGYCRISDLVKGSVNMEIDEMKIRIIACNLEHGMYSTIKGTDGKNRSVVKCFDAPIHEFLLFEKTIYNILKGENLKKYLDDKIYFKKIYDNLYPKNMVSKEYGVDCYWEIQLIHDNFINYHVPLPNERFDDVDFY